MKFRFITILHNLELDTIKNKGTQVFPGARVSNGTQVLSETLDTKLMHATLGVHSVNEFNNSVYFYIDGECSDIQSKEKMDEIGTEHTFFYLRQAQDFAQKLWEIKDNNVYVRDGFLIAYHEHFEDGFTYKASLSEVFTYATTEKKKSFFSNSEITSAIKDFEPSKLEEFEEESFGGKWPNSSHLFKAFGSDRMTRASYFTGKARASSIIPIKIVLYCNALECLFTTGKSEINHKIAERVALMLGTSQESKKELFQLVKSAYGTRSTLVHGQSLKGTEDKLVYLSKGLDNILRELIVHNHEIFSKEVKEDKMNNFFIDLLFTD